jgi:ABC-2 type transport system ATP-binding protein
MNPVIKFTNVSKRFGDLNPAQKIEGLSKGTRAKVALSLAMAHHPQLLIMDEPTSGLDPLVRREFLESMIDVAAEGRWLHLEMPLFRI